MKRVLLTSLMAAALANSAWAEEDKPGVSDLTQPRPPATVTATNVATVVNTTIEEQGLVIDETEELIIKEPVSTSVVSTTNTALAPAEIIDGNLDLGQTMEVMGKSFKAIKKAKSTNEMIEPLERLTVFASQAHALGGAMHDAKRADFEMGIEQLRIDLAELKAAVDVGDMSEAQKLIEEINESRKKSHEYFNVK